MPAALPSSLHDDGGTCVLVSSVKAERYDELSDRCFRLDMDNRYKAQRIQELENGSLVGSLERKVQELEMLHVAFATETDKLLQAATTKHHWYEAEIKIRDQRIQELEEQVASLQRVIQHRRDSDSVVDA